MPYYVVENFAAGVDTRKQPWAAPPGTLREALNVHVTPGGEVEKRKSFVEVADLTGSFGLAHIGNTLYVFGTAAAPGGFPLSISGTDVTVQYVQLAGGVDTPDYLRSWTVFQGGIHAVVSVGAAGIPRHYYNGVYASEGIGRAVKTFKSKVFSVKVDSLNSSAVLDPTDWTTAAGFGFLDVSTDEATATDLEGLEIYYGKMAVFGSRAILIYEVDPDWNKTFLVQSLRGIGLIARASPAQFGNGDVLFLSQTGVRSLQARDSSNSAAVSDVGSPIDQELQDLILTAAEDYYRNSRAVIEAATGRYWLSFGGFIWVLSLFPGPKVTAWTKYLTTDAAGNAFSVQDMVSFDTHTFVRGTNDKLYLYGGTTGQVYDASEAKIRLPHLSMDRPADHKTFYGLDIIAQGTWTVKADFDPAATALTTIATIAGASPNFGRVAFDGHAPGVTFELSSVSASRARLASVIAHYDLSVAE